MRKNKYQILSTRSLDPLLIKEAKEHGIDIEKRDYISIQPRLSDKLKKKVGKIIRQSGVNVIFTSKNAIKIIGKYYLQPEDDLDGNYVAPEWNIYSLENVTFATVQQYFRKRQIKGVAPTASLLADVILQNKEISSVVFFCGSKRRHELREKLRKAGVQVKEIIVYDTLEAPSIAGGKYAGILFFSPSAVSSFFSKNSLPATTVCFTIGNTTAEALKIYTDNKTIISDSADTEAMMDTVISYFDHFN